MLIKDATRDNSEHIIIKVSLEVGSPDNDFVEYELWMGSLLDI